MPNSIILNLYNTLLVNILYLKYSLPIRAPSTLILLFTIFYLKNPLSIRVPKKYFYLTLYYSLS
jgi:hypothetical protein